MLQDIRFAGRSLRKRPGVTFIVMITLALGIGANTAIFTVVNAVLLSPLPYGEPAQLVVLWGKVDKPKPLTQQPISYANYKDWCEQNQVFAQLAAVRGVSFSLLDRGEPELVSGARVTANILPLLGVKPLVGRDFLPEEEQASKAPVALISYGLWLRRYNADPHIIGQTVTLDGQPSTIIGVLPKGLKYPGLNVPLEGAEVWIPFVPLPNEQVRSFANVRVVGKLKAGVTLQKAQAEMNVIAARLAQQYP